MRKQLLQGVQHHYLQSKQLLNNNKIMQSYNQEVIVIVDETNNIIGEALRSELTKKRLIIRTTYILLIDSSTKKFYVQKRAKLKFYCPSHWDVFFGGVVQINESYEQNAIRELKEETGVDRENLGSLFDFYFDQSQNTKSWGRVFPTYYSGGIENLRHDPKETELIELMSLEEIYTKIKNEEQFTPDGIIALNRFVTEGFYNKLCQ